MFRNSAPDSYNPARRKLLRSAALILGFIITGARGLFARAQENSGAAAEVHLEETLQQLARHLFPHDTLPAAPYKEVATALISRASADSKVAKTLQGGVAQLDEGSPTPWLMRGEAQQTAAIKKIEGGEFFRLMRTTAIEHLYRNREVWKLLGYQGSSVELGGYVDRGFDDIDWLPGESKAQ
jgi:hypothetical protein